MPTLRPSLEVRSPSGELLGLMDDGVIRRFPAHVLVRPWILNPITEVERAYERPETVELRTEIWRQGGSLSYRVIQASTEDPDQLDAIPTFRRPAEKVLR